MRIVRQLGIGQFLEITESHVLSLLLVLEVDFIVSLPTTRAVFFMG